MNEQEFENERLYQETIGVFRTMLDKGLISREEYLEIDTRMIDRYRPKTGGLLSEIRLTSSP